MSSHTSVGPIKWYPTRHIAVGTLSIIARGTFGDRDVAVQTVSRVGQQRNRGQNEIEMLQQLDSHKGIIRLC